MDKSTELMIRALLIGEKYRESNKKTKIEVGELMTRNRKIIKKKKLIDSTNTYKLELSIR